MYEKLVNKKCTFTVISGKNLKDDGFCIVIIDENISIKPFQRNVPVDVKLGRVKNVFRSRSSNEELVFKRFFIDLDGLDWHFSIFLNKRTESEKIEQIGIKLVNFWPLDNELTAVNLLNELKNKLVSKNVEIIFIVRENDYGKFFNIQTIKFQG